MLGRSCYLGLQQIISRQYSPVDGRGVVDASTNGGLNVLRWLGQNSYEVLSTHGSSYK